MDVAKPRARARSEDLKFKVPLPQKLRFARALLIHFLGSNRSIRTGLTSNEPRPAGPQDAPLKARAAGRGPDFTVGTAQEGVPDSRKAAILRSEFNSITPENALKWGRLLAGSRLGTYDFSPSDQMVEYAQREGLGVHGHALLWGKLPGMGYPADLEEALCAAQNPRARLLEIIEDHLCSVLNHFRGKVKVWDVVNEPFELSGPKLDNNLFLRHLGPGYIETAFRTAHSVDPSLRLVLNEQMDDYAGSRSREYLRLVEDLLSKGTPIHTLGLQSHLLFDLPSPQDVEVFLRRISGLGLRFEITEFDLRIGLFKYARNPYQAQADYAKRLVDVFMRFPQCTGITFWSCFDDAHWMDQTMPLSLMKPNAASLFAGNLTKKPIYHALGDSLGTTSRGETEKAWGP